MDFYWVLVEWSIDDDFNQVLALAELAHNKPRVFKKLIKETPSELIKTEVANQMLSINRQVGDQEPLRRSTALLVRALHPKNTRLEWIRTQLEVKHPEIIKKALQSIEARRIKFEDDEYVVLTA